MERIETNEILYPEKVKDKFNEIVDWISTQNRLHTGTTGSDGLTATRVKEPMNFDCIVCHQCHKSMTAKEYHSHDCSKESKGLENTLKIRLDPDQVRDIVIQIKEALREC